MKRKGLALLIGAAMMAASLVGCGGKDTGADNSTKADNTAKADNAENVVQESVADSGEVIELEFWGWWSSEARQGNHATSWQTIWRRFASAQVRDRWSRLIRS